MKICIAELLLAVAGVNAAYLYSKDAAEPSNAAIAEKKDEYAVVDLHHSTDQGYGGEDKSRSCSGLACFSFLFGGKGSQAEADSGYGAPTDDFTPPQPTTTSTVTEFVTKTKTLMETSTQTEMQTVTRVRTRTATVTEMSTCTRTATATLTEFATKTATLTRTETTTCTETATAFRTITSTHTDHATKTDTITKTETAFCTETATLTKTKTATVKETKTITVEETKTVTVEETNFVTPTPHCEGESCFSFLFGRGSNGDQNKEALAGDKAPEVEAEVDLGCVKCLPLFHRDIKVDGTVQLDQQQQLANGKDKKPCCQN